jgi:hypothetical protein
MKLCLKRLDAEQSTAFHPEVTVSSRPVKDQERTMSRLVETIRCKWVGMRPGTYGVQIRDFHEKDG